MRELLIIFIKNAELGKVKTRLAATVGNERALEVYRLLLLHTLSITRDLKCDKVVYYSDFIPSADEWHMSGFFQAVQSQGDLGEKMLNSFSDGFSQHYSSIVIIGSDCHELRSEHIRDAFSALINADVVVGPAYDGGYYLLGMTKLQEELFRNKLWSSPSVLADTINDIENLSLKYIQLAKLHDIDNEEDLTRSTIKFS